MNWIRKWRREETAEVKVPAAREIDHAADEICEKAIKDAKEQLHPLMKNTELHQLRNRSSFVQAFKRALEHQTAQKLAAWVPEVQAVFQFEETWMEKRETWDGSLHLLVKVPSLSDTIKELGEKLDANLTNRLQQLGWSRFRNHHSVLEVQQVTVAELRLGIGYGAMFHAVHNLPVQVWAPKR